MHEPPAAIAGMAVLPGVLGSSCDGLRTSSPCDVLTSMPQVRAPVVARHATQAPALRVARPSPQSRHGVSCIMRASHETTIAPWPLTARVFAGRDGRELPRSSRRGRRRPDAFPGSGRRTVAQLRMKAKRCLGWHEKRIEDECVVYIRGAARGDVRALEGTSRLWSPLRGRYWTMTIPARVPLGMSTGLAALPMG
jgi:hypothetical protein